jgi:metallo-beta-lactamase family protein
VTPAAAPRLRFLGACGTVTGSRFLVEADDQVLVDCGLFQGERAIRRRNWEPVPLDPGALTGAVLTHAHLDHTGYLPVLVKGGFTGPVLATPETCALAALVLRDSGHLQAEDARFAREHGFSKHDPPRALYDEADAEAALAVLRPTPFGEPTTLGEVGVELRAAGHILGSSSARLTVGGRTLLVTGDLGRPQHPLLRPPAPRPATDVVLVESTYGDRRHPPDETDRLADVICRTVRRGGTVLVPAFAVDRTEVVLHALHRLHLAGRIPEVPVFVDSPMALAALRVYVDALRDRAPDVRDDLDPDPFGLAHVRLAADVGESMALNRPAEPSIVVSASGMASGGRVVHHLAALAGDSRNTVVLVGFQAPGTRGADLARGATQVKALGRYLPVRCQVEVFQGMSVHADADELVDWLAGAGPDRPPVPDVCYVVHGEPSASRTLAERLHHELGWLAVVPDDGEVVRLD